jgi:hypothetical protein
MIHLDGRELGMTPIYRHRLPAGPHVIEAVREDGVRQRREIRIQPQREASIIIRW